jgi:hypothetical protein
VHERRSLKEDGRTEKPGEDAQGARSVTPQMMALSTLPVPTRLRLLVRKRISEGRRSGIPLVDVCYARVSEL